MCFHRRKRDQAGRNKRRFCPEEGRRKRDGNLPKRYPSLCVAKGAQGSTNVGKRSGTAMV